MSSFPVSNCYRAILAQVNCLDSVYVKKEHLKGIYEEISELAYYIMENDEQRIFKKIEQINLVLGELEHSLWAEPRETDATIKLILDEIRTHLQYLLIQFQYIKNHVLFDKFMPD